VLGVVAAVVLVTPSLARGQAGWYLTPSVSVSESYDDNIFRSSLVREEDFITNVTPGLRLAYQSAPLTLALSYSTTYAKFVEHPELDNVGNRQRGTLEFNFVPGPETPWTLSLNASHASTEDTNEVDPAAATEGRLVTTVTSAGASATYKLTPAMSTVGKVSYARQEVEGVTATDTYSAGLSLNYTVTQNDTVSLNYSFSLFQSAVRERVSHALTAGWDRQIYEDLKAGLHLGARVTDGTVTPDVGGNLDGAIRPIQGLSVSASYADTVRVVAGKDEPEQVRALAVTATYAPPLVQYLTLTGGPAVSYVTKLGGGDERTVFRLTATVSYAYPLTKWLTAQLSYNYSYRVNGDELVQNVVTVGLSASYPVRVY